MTSEFGIRVGSVLRSMREASKAPQAKIAFLLGKDQSQISRIERGLEDIRFGDINKLCRYFGVSMVDFVARVKYEQQTSDWNSR